jgi:hypothetical protein
MSDSPYVKVAYTIHSDVTHWATRNGLYTICGILVPGLDPSDVTRPYDPAWEVKKSRLSLVTCKKCNGDSRGFRH